VPFKLLKSIQAGITKREKTYTNPHKLHSTETEAQTSNPGKDADESHRIAIEFESDGLRVKHRSNQCSFGSIKTLPKASKNGPTNAVSSTDLF
jgi:hypothetical protein